MLGNDDSYFWKGDSFFRLRNHLPAITVFKRTPLFCRRRRSQFMNELMLVKRKSDWHLHLGGLPLGKVGTLAKQVIWAMESSSAQTEGLNRPGTHGPANA